MTSNAKSVMIISKQQMRAFLDARKQAFERELAHRLQEGHPTSHTHMPSEGDDLLLFVRREIQKALTYNISSERALTAYVTASWIAGTSIDNDSNVRSVLERRDLAQYHRALQALKYARNMVHNDDTK